jgi:hypothetical protein
MIEGVADDVGRALSGMHAGPAAEEPEHRLVERDPLGTRERADASFDLVAEAPDGELAK